MKFEEIIQTAHNDGGRRSHVFIQYLCSQFILIIQGQAYRFITARIIVL